ncbi:hypothetical protein TTHERM_00561470 (macronuclear) [Tetrahymena thermophila SB210]|uniref:Protein kinase domain-containing protein n=1 Tax=Tetrahymena thermophila (strain SB210) TaxID=312017 RepID=I7MHX1_TETTS|nr:hypothetical protein TTHERM_00561470 [Tetrahymena thermophila SB210]EAR89956.2 hypothetical protein TTHERM_00561470 [Tetrahymena thermophila SB210]|eukprot:XP_001010201.2 hypothetical protein TTHERM_00561470 [Tetrahymena thermophila SB210]
MGNQKSSSYPLCSIQYECERNRQEQKVDNKSYLQGQSQQDEHFNQELTDDYFGKVVVITKKFAQSKKKSNSSANLDSDILKDQVGKDNQTILTSSCLIIEKTFQDQNQLNEALKSVNLLQKIIHPNIINIQSTQTIATTNQNNDKLFVGRVQCDYYSENLFSVLKKRKLIISQLNQKSSLSLNGDKKQEQSVPSSTSRSYSSQKKQSKQTYKKNPSSQVTPRGNQNSYVPAFTEKEIWYIIDSVVDTLNLLQQKSIIHGDLRPQTIFFTHDGHLKLSIVQCYNKDFSHTNFHIATHHILKTKQLQQKIQEDNILLSLEQLNQLQKLNPVAHNNSTQQTKNLAKQILSNLEFDPYKSQVFSFGMLLLQIIFCGNVECCQAPLNSQQFQQKSNLNASQNIKYLYITNEKTKDVTINFQLVFDLLSQVKQMFSLSLYQILSTCLEAKEQKRPNCIELYNQLHNLDLQTEASLTMDEFVTVKRPLQLEYQQNLSQKLKIPPLDVRNLETTPKQDQNSNNLIGGATLLNNYLFQKNQQFENLQYCSSQKMNLSDINLNQNINSKINSSQKNNQKHQNCSELLKSPSHPKEIENENEKKLNNFLKNVQVDIIQRSKNDDDEMQFQSISKQNNLLNKSKMIQNELSVTNKKHLALQEAEQIKSKNQKENQFDYKQQLEIDQKNYQSILKHKSYSLVQSYQTKTTKDIKNQITNTQQFKSIKQQSSPISIPCFKISESKLQNQDFNQQKNVSLLADKQNSLIIKNQPENTQKINQISIDNNNKYSSQFCTNLNQQFLNNKQIAKNESVSENRISNFSEYPTQNSGKEYSVSNHNNKDCLNSNKDTISISNQSIIKDNNNFLNQNQITIMTTGRRQSESSTTNQSLSTTLQFYNPLSNQAVTSIKSPEISIPYVGHQKFYSLNLNLNNDMSSQKPYERTNKNFYFLNTQEEKKGTELQKEYDSIQNKSSIHTEQASKQNISYLSNDQNFYQSKLQSPQQSTYSFNQFNLYNSNNQSQVLLNNYHVQQRSINLIDNLAFDGKQNSIQIYQKDIPSQIKNVNQLNSTTIDNSNSFLSSQNFKSENFHHQQNLYQPDIGLYNNLLKSPYSQNIVKFNEQNLQQSQIIHQSIDLNESLQKKFLGESCVNINANTYTFSSPQNQRFEELKNSQQFLTEEKVKHAQQGKTYLNQNSIENHLQQTAKFVNESSRHQFSTSIHEQISKHDTLKDEITEQCFSHVYGSPQRVIVSRSNIQSPLNYIQSPITQRNKSYDFYNKTINQIGSEIYSQKNYNLKQIDQNNNNNNSKTLIILSPQKNISTNTKLTTTPSKFESEKNYLNQLVKNDDVQSQNSLAYCACEVKEKQILQTPNISQSKALNEQLDTLNNEGIANKNIEIEEWNDIESYMSENLQNSMSESIKVNSTLLNTHIKDLSSLIVQNRSFENNQIGTKNQTFNISNNYNTTSQQYCIDNQKNKLEQQPKSILLLSNNNLKNMQNNNSILHQTNNTQNIKIDIQSNNNFQNSQYQQKTNHKRYQSTTLTPSLIQENLIPRNQSHSIHQINLTSPKQDGSTNLNMQKNVFGSSNNYNNFTQTNNQTISNKNISQNYQPYQHINSLNQNNLGNLNSQIKQNKTQNNQISKNKEDQETSFQTLNQAKIMSNKVISVSNNGSPFYSPNPIVESSKYKQILTSNNNSYKIQQLDFKQQNNSLQALKLNYLLSPSNTSTQFTYSSPQSQVKKADKYTPSQFNQNFQQNFNFNKSKEQVADKVSLSKSQLNNNIQQRQQKLQYQKQQSKLIQDNFSSQSQIY